MRRLLELFFWRRIGWRQNVVNDCPQDRKHLQRNSQSAIDVGLGPTAIANIPHRRGREIQNTVPNTNLNDRLNDGRLYVDGLDYRNINTAQLYGSLGHGALSLNDYGHLYSCAKGNK